MRGKKLCQAMKKAANEPMSSALALSLWRGVNVMLNTLKIGGDSQKLLLRFNEH